MSPPPLIEMFDDAGHNCVVRLMLPESENSPPGIGQQSIRLVVTPNVGRHL